MFDWIQEQYRKTPGGKVLDPADPQKVTDSDAYKNTNDFANGIKTQRTNFSRTPTPTVQEGAPPPPAGLAPPAAPPPGMTVAGIHFAYGRQPHPGTPGAPTPGGGTTPGGPSAPVPDDTVYADPTGADAQKRALALSEAAANGNAPSQAEALFRRGIDEGMQNQLNMAATTQGSNPGISQRAGQAGAANVSLSSSASAAALRADEMAKARGEFATGSKDMRSQTYDESRDNADRKLKQQLIDNQFYLGLSDEELKARIAEIDANKTDTQAKNDFDAGQRKFYADSATSIATGAPGGGGAPKK